MNVINFFIFDDSHLWWNTNSYHLGTTLILAMTITEIHRRRKGGGGGGQGAKAPQ